MLLQLVFWWWWCRALSDRLLQNLPLVFSLAEIWWLSMKSIKSLQLYSQTDNHWIIIWCTHIFPLVNSVVCLYIFQKYSATNKNTNRERERGGRQIKALRINSVIQKWSTWAKNRQNDLSQSKLRDLFLRVALDVFMYSCWISIHPQQRENLSWKNMTLIFTLQQR